MPIPVACSCGKRFAAKDQLAGKRVKCPACGGAIAIPNLPAQPEPTRAEPAADSLFANDPFGSTPAASGGALELGNLSQFEGPAVGASAGAMGGGSVGKNQTPGARPAPAERGMSFPVKLALFGGGAAVLLFGAAVGIFALSGFFSSPVAQLPSAPSTGSPAPSVGAPATPSPAAATPGGPAASPAPSALSGNSDPPGFPPNSTPGVGSSSPHGGPPPAFPPLASAAGRSSAGGSMSPVGAGKPLPGAVTSWHGQPDAELLGVKPVKGEDLVVYQYSWMCDVLPFLGYEKLYNDFDFNQPWTDDPNLSLTRTVVPQFLNPLDDRRQWRGYPFQGTALTHFVGMSGLEDRRNVLAAELPRSDPRAGVFGYHGIAKPSEITDGTSNTLMLIGSGELAAPWVQGGGATIRGARQPYFDALSGFGSRGSSQPGALAMFADGSVRHIPANIDPQVFRALCTIHGAETVDLAPLGVVKE